MKFEDVKWGSIFIYRRPNAPNEVMGPMKKEQVMQSCGCCEDNAVFDDGSSVAFNDDDEVELISEETE